MTPQARLARLKLRAPSRTRFIGLAIMVPLVVAALLGWLAVEYRQSDDLRQQVADSYERRLEMVTLLSRIKDAEAAQRGYVLTGDPSYLDAYAPAVRDARALLAHASQAGPHAVAPAQIAALRTLSEAKFGEMDRTIAARRNGDPSVAITMVRSGIGKAHMDRMRTAIGTMIDQEHASTAQRQADFTKQRAWLSQVVITVFIVLVVMLCIGMVVVWRSRRERHDALIAALAAAERNNAILNSTVDAILILNPCGKIEVINAAAMTMLGYSGQDLDRSDIAALIDLAPGDGNFHARIGLEDGVLDHSYLTDRRIRHRDGREIPVDVALGVMHVPSGDHIVVSLRDITARKRIDQVKEDLISTVTHELRTPLTSIVGSLGLMRAGAAGILPAAAERLVSIAENNSRRLIRLINDMLDIDRIESGKLRLQCEPIDLRDVARRVCEGSQGLASAADVRVECVLPPQPVIVSGDADRLLQVLTNLASNAIRAAPPGSAVTIGIATTDDNRATATVDDDGTGIPDSFRNRIFGRFERADRQDNGAGTGLGLAISREIIERHGGRIWFEDRAGGGTRFAVSLPLLGTGAARPVETHEPRLTARRIADLGGENAPDARHPTVLHLDDDQDLLDVVAFALQPEMHIIKVKDLDSARATLARSPPDIAIIDVQLNGGSGLDLLPALIDADGRSIPTIIYSAQEVSSADAARVDAVLVKARGSIPDLKATVRQMAQSRDTGGSTLLEDEAR